MNPDDPDAAEARVSELLEDLRADTPEAPSLPQSIAGTARWQAPVRRALLRAATTAGGVADGVAGLVRGRRPR